MLHRDARQKESVCGCLNGYLVPEPSLSISDYLRVAACLLRTKRTYTAVTTEIAISVRNTDNAPMTVR